MLSITAKAKKKEKEKEKKEGENGSGGYNFLVIWVDSCLCYGQILLR